MKRKTIPYIIGIPDMAVGLMWVLNMTAIPKLAGTVTQSNWKIGVLVSMGAFTGLFMQYLAGVLGDRSNFKTGKRIPFIYSGAFFAIFFVILLPFAKTYLIMFILAFSFYAGLNFFQGAYYSSIPEIVGHSQLGLANSMAKVFSIIGSAILFLSVAPLWEIDRSLPFILAAVICLLTVGSTFYFVKEEETEYIATSRLSFEVLKHKPAMRLNLVVFFIFLSYGSITPFFVRYCQSALKLTEGEANSSLLVLTISGALFAYPIGLAADRFSRQKVLFAGCVIFAAGLTSGIFVSTVQWLYAVMGIIGLGFIAIPITMFSILPEISPKERLGEFMGVMNFFVSISQFLASCIMGFLLDIFGFKYFFPATAALMIIAAVIAYKSSLYENEKLNK